LEDEMTKTYGTAYGPGDDPRQVADRLQDWFDSHDRCGHSLGYRNAMDCEHETALSYETSRPLVAAVLAVTPVDPEGLVITGFVAIKAFDGGQLPEFGAPETIAARQSVAVLRWLADNAPEHDYGEFIEHAWTDDDLGRLADKIERPDA
jgi:hypothetical protein